VEGVTNSYYGGTLMNETDKKFKRIEIINRINTWINILLGVSLAVTILISISFISTFTVPDARAKGLLNFVADSHSGVLLKIGLVSLLVFIGSIIGRILFRKKYRKDILD